MNKKFLLSLLFVVLSIQMVSAAYTITWNLPAAGSTYNNNAMNRQTIDLNFTVVDNNADIVRDVNILLRYWDKVGGPSGASTIVAYADWNFLSRTDSTKICSTDTWAAGKKCKYQWTMPLNATMPEGTYLIDVNVYSYTRLVQYSIYDKNATVEIVISTKLSNIATLRSMLGTLMAILVVGALIAITGMGIVFKPNPTDFVRNSFLIGIIAVAIGIVIGIVVALM